MDLGDQEVTPACLSLLSFLSYSLELGRGIEFRSILAKGIKASAYVTYHSFCFAFETGSYYVT